MKRSKRRWKHSIQAQVPLNCNGFDTFACSVLRYAATEFPWRREKIHPRSHQVLGQHIHVWTCWAALLAPGSAGTQLKLHWWQNLPSFRRKTGSHLGWLFKIWRTCWWSRANLYISLSLSLLVVRGEHHRHEDERYWIGNQEVCELTGGRLVFSTSKDHWIRSSRLRDVPGAWTEEQQEAAIATRYLAHGKRWSRWFPKSCGVCWLPPESTYAETCPAARWNSL